MASDEIHYNGCLCAWILYNLLNLPFLLTYFRLFLGWICILHSLQNF